MDVEDLTLGKSLAKREGKKEEVGEQKWCGVFMFVFFCSVFCFFFYIFCWRLGRFFLEGYRILFFLGWVVFLLFSDFDGFLGRLSLCF